jgi:signal transduction histidine kinase
MAEPSHDLLATPEVLVHVATGQVFFLIGLVITLRRWRTSHLALATSLPWLAGFGYLNAGYHWVDAVVPSPLAGPQSALVEILLVVRVSLLAASFASLLQFGVTTWDPSGRRDPLRIAAVAAAAAWAAFAVGPATAVARDVAEWGVLTTVAARYGVGLPAAFLAALGLRRQAKRLIAPLDLPSVWRMLRLGGMSLGAYGVAAGLVVPAAPFFPANVLNEERLAALTLVPADVWRSLFGLVLAAAIVRAMGAFRSELDQQLAQVQEAEALVRERERFGRELHDGTLQTIYAAGLVLRSTEADLADAPPQALERLRQGLGLLDQAVADIRRYLGALAPRAPEGGLVEELEALAAAPYLAALLDVRLEVEPSVRGLDGSRAVAHVVAICQEALSNAVRHARARTVHIEVSAGQDRLQLVIRDDGRGIVPGSEAGSGLRNMRDRARLLGGDLEVVGTVGEGTVVRLDVPWREET